MIQSNNDLEGDDKHEEEINVDAPEEQLRRRY